jgi:hypothetical protein
MAFLNKQEREALLNELAGMKFNRAQWKLARLDPKGRLAYIRNAQAPGQLWTRYELTGLGTRVTLIEEHSSQADKAGKSKADNALIEVVVEPTPENRT